MRLNLIISLLLVGILNFHTVATGAPRSWDVKADWALQNPNGPWSYRDIAGRLLSSHTGNQGTLGGAPRGWKLPEVDTPTLFRDLWQPEGLVGGNDVESIAGHGPWVVVWESDFDGLIEISGHGFQMFSGPRVMHFMLRQNGKVFTEFYSKTAKNKASGKTWGQGGRAGAVSFASGSARAEVLTRQVRSGDTIEVIAQGSAGPKGNAEDPGAATWACLDMNIKRVGGKPEQLTPMAKDNYERVKQMMQRYPKPMLAGVDLSWHMDRSIDYAHNVVDLRREFVPYYRNCVYFGPTKLAHAQWDVPHCVGRLVDLMMIWEASVNRRVKDERVLMGLRELLHESILEDHLAHFPAYCRESKEIDWHSQREVLLSLLGLSSQRNDETSLALAQKLVKSYYEHYLRQAVPMDAMNSGRFIEALLNYHRLTNDPMALDLAQQLADFFYDSYFDDKGTFPTPGNDQATLQTVGELIDFGIYTNQAKYVHKGKRIIDTGLWTIRTKFGFIFENEGPRGELNCSGDLVKAEIMLGLNGYPEYFDDAERVLRNHMLASQYLDPSIATGPTAKEAGVKDNDEEMFTNASVRALGGFAFTLPNDLIEPGISEAADVPADMVGGVTHGIVAIWNHIVTEDHQGLHVNFLLSKNTPEINVRSYLPVQGRVELEVKSKKTLLVRIPQYVHRDKLTVKVDKENLTKRFVGPYLMIARQKLGSTIVIEFDQEIRIEEETSSGVTYRVEWLGDTVWNITPAGKQVPLYYPARLAMYGYPLQ